MRINHKKPRTIKGRRKHKVERKGMVKMWATRHYKAKPCNLEDEWMCVTTCYAR